MIVNPQYGMAKSMVSLPNGEISLAGVGRQAYSDKVIYPNQDHENYMINFSYSSNSFIFELQVARFSNGTWKEVRIWC